jgi:uncharacterized protein YkwD
MLTRSWLRSLTLTTLIGLSLATPAQVAADPAETVLSVINSARAKAGCGPLRLNQKLMGAAETHARNMAEKDFFGHKGKDGSQLSNRIKRQGYQYRSAAENIAAGQANPTQVAQDWLASPGHRRNILNCALKDTGIAVVYQPDDQPIMGNATPFQYYWVQVFATP